MFVRKHPSDISPRISHQKTKEIRIARQWMFGGVIGEAKYLVKAEYVWIGLKD
jgi:hypothetical protein